MKNKYLERLLDKLAAEFDPEIVPVIVEEYSELLQCYNNVEQKVKNDGGKIHYGWKIHQTNLLCEAEHHAVWENDAEDLIDVTPNESNESEILFVSDNKYVYDGKEVDNVRLNATTNPLVDDLIFICETLAKFYAFCERKNYEVVTVDQAIFNYIEEYSQFKVAFLQYLKDGANNFSSCLCGNPKMYKNCHQLILKEKMLKDLEEARERHNKINKVIIK